MSKTAVRSALAASVAFALLPMWLITQDPDDTKPNDTLSGGEATPVTIPRPADVRIEPQEALRSAGPDEVIVEYVESTGVDATANRGMEIELGSSMRAAIVDYLSDSGLAPADGERIADSALGGVRECVAQVLGNLQDVSASNRAETCMFNVLAAHGLNQLAVTEIELNISQP